MGALLSPQQPARTSGRTGLKGDHGEKVRGGGRGCPCPAAPVPALLAPLPFLLPVPVPCRGPFTPQAGSVPAPFGNFLLLPELQGRLQKRLLCSPEQELRPHLALCCCWSDPSCGQGPLCSLQASPERCRSWEASPACSMPHPCVALSPWGCSIPTVGSCWGSPGSRPGPTAWAGGHGAAGATSLPGFSFHPLLHVASLQGDRGPLGSRGHPARG